MTRASLNNRSNRGPEAKRRAAATGLGAGRRGIVLLLTLVLLVVLCTLGYTLTSRVAAQRHRERYLIDYQAARYGCDSAVKYALATLEDINEPQLVARPNEPDFSDLFALSEQEYEQYLAEWAAEMQREEAEEGGGFKDVNDVTGPIDIAALIKALGGGVEANDLNDVNDINDANYAGRIRDYNEPNSLTIRGPYGSPWPFITEPRQFEIGSATVRIEIEDENAKYPLSWALMDDKEVEREVMTGFKTFCEWMDINDVEIDSLRSQLEEIGKIKPFKLEFKPISKRTRVTAAPASQRRGRRSRRPPSRYRTTTVSVSQQVTKQAEDFARFFHSSLIDTETLARPTVVSESRKESALKYLGTWASSKVNINTAPRHVLEAAFAFGGDQVPIADGVIERRRIKPFKDLSDLTSSLLSYSDSIRKCEKYVTTTSTFFTIRVTAVSGVAEASAVIAIMKDGGKMKRIAVISG